MIFIFSIFQRLWNLITRLFSEPQVRRTLKRVLWILVEKIAEIALQTVKEACDPTK